MQKKRHITLLEMMIVIFLIGIISTVIGYNMKGSLDKGKIFKSQQAQAQIKDILLLEVAKGTNIDDVVNDPKKYLQESGLVKNVDDFLKDGWGAKFTVKAIDRKTDIEVTSTNINKYEKKVKSEKQDTQSEGKDYY